VVVPKSFAGEPIQNYADDKKLRTLADGSFPPAFC